MSVLTREQYNVGDAGSNALIATKKSQSNNRKHFTSIVINSRKVHQLKYHDETWVEIGA